jgi:hypothetical protein
MSNQYSAARRWQSAIGYQPSAASYRLPAVVYRKSATKNQKLEMRKND